MKFRISLSLLLIATSSHAAYEDFSTDNSSYTQAQHIGYLTVAPNINVFGARGEISIFGTTISDDNKADFYSFNAETAQDVSMNVLTSFGPQQINDPYPSFFNASTGVQLATNNNGGAGNDSFLSYNIIDTGSYVLAVTGFGDNDFTGTNAQTNFLYTIELSDITPIPDVDAVPIPAAAWLFGGALFSVFGVIGSLRRRTIVSTIME